MCFNQDLMKLRAEIRVIIPIYLANDATDRFLVNLRLNGATELVISSSFNSQLLQLALGKRIAHPEAGQLLLVISRLTTSIKNAADSFRSRKTDSPATVEFRERVHYSHRPLSRKSRCHPQCSSVAAASGIAKS